MKKKHIMVIPADGIGVEVVPLAVEFIQQLQDGLEFTHYDAGYSYFKETGKSMSERIWEDAGRSDGIIFGCTATPSPPPPGYASPILQLRKRLDLSVNIRHCRSFHLQENMDVLMFRNASEGLYSGIERMGKGVAIADYVVSRKETERLAIAAAQAAKTRKGVVTIVHKANVLAADAYFREVCIEVLTKAGVEWRDALADAAGYFLVKEPARYDVMVMTSHVGDILSDVAAAVVGGLGVVPSLSEGPSIFLAEPIHGAAPDIVNQGLANPIATILSAAMLLEALDYADAAGRIQACMEKAFRQHHILAARSTKQIMSILQACL